MTTAPPEDQTPVNPDDVACTQTRFTLVVDVPNIESLGEGLNVLASTIGRLGVDGLRLHAYNTETDENYLVHDGEATLLGDLSSQLAAMEAEDGDDEG